MRQVEQLRNTLQSCATVMRQNGLNVPPGGSDIGSPGGLVSPYGNVYGKLHQIYPYVLPILTTQIGFVVQACCF